MCYGVEMFCMSRGAPRWPISEGESLCVPHLMKNKKKTDERMKEWMEMKLSILKT
jgi:hypothetical protein